MIAGYSFPPTDFHVRRLLREAFSDRSPHELHVINPDSAVAINALRAQPTARAAPAGREVFLLDPASTGGINRMSHPHDGPVGARAP